MGLGAEGAEPQFQHVAGEQQLTVGVDQAVLYYPGIAVDLELDRLAFAVHRERGIGLVERDRAEREEKKRGSSQPTNDQSEGPAPADGGN